MKVSTKRYCLTPGGEFYLIGYGNRYASRRNVAKGVHDDIYANVILLEIDGKEVYIFNADFLELEEDSCNEIKMMLMHKYGIDPNLVLLSVTHNHHSIMSYHKHWETGFFSQVYYDFLISIIVKGYEECHASLQECSAFFGKGMVDGYYGSRIYYGERADNEVILVEFRDHKNEVITALCNWSTHSTVLNPENALLTSDFAGGVCEALYKLRGYYPLMIVGAAGDCSNRAYRKGDDFVELARISIGVAEQINAIVCNQKLDIAYDSNTLVTYGVNYIPDVDIDALKKQIEEIEAKMHSEPDEQQRKLYYDDSKNLKRKLDLEAVDIQLYASIIKLNDLEIVTSPGELGSKLGIELKVASSKKCCMIFGYTNGYKSYILQPELMKDSARSQGSKYRVRDVRGYIDAIKAKM